MGRVERGFGPEYCDFTCRAHSSRTMSIFGIDSGRVQYNTASRYWRCAILATTIQLISVCLVCLPK